MSTSGSIFALTSKEDRGEQLSPHEQRLVDDYWRRHAVPLTPEQRQKFLAAAERGLRYRRERIDGWRWVLFVTIWWLSGKEPVWHDFYDCSKCHPWPSQPWVGPYELGEEIDGAQSD